MLAAAAPQNGLQMSPTPSPNVAPPSDSFGIRGTKETKGEHGGLKLATSGWGGCNHQDHSEILTLCAACSKMFQMQWNAALPAQQAKTNYYFAGMSTVSHMSPLHCLPLIISVQRAGCPTLCRGCFCTAC